MIICQLFIISWGRAERLLMNLIYPRHVDVLFFVTTETSYVVEYLSMRITIEV